MTEKEKIVDMAVSIIRDEIRTQVYDCSDYPTMESTHDGHVLSLKVLTDSYMVSSSQREQGA